METKQVAISQLKVSGCVKLSKARSSNKNNVIGRIIVDNRLHVLDGAEHLVQAIENGLHSVEVQFSSKTISLKNISNNATHKILSKTHIRRR
jgi:hypothetical protein